MSQCLSVGDMTGPSPYSLSAVYFWLGGISKGKGYSYNTQTSTSLLIGRPPAALKNLGNEYNLSEQAQAKSVGGAYVEPGRMDCGCC